MLLNHQLTLLLINNTVLEEREGEIEIEGGERKGGRRESEKEAQLKPLVKGVIQ